MRSPFGILARASVAALLCLCVTTSAQTPRRRAPARDAESQRAPQTRSDADADANADLSITARVTARELIFRKVPNPRVEFTGQPERETVWESDRENLPPQVQPGVAYRNIGITLRITSVFGDIERIVAEALGEIPLSDDAPEAAHASDETAQAPPATPPQASPAAAAPSRAPSAAAPRRAARRGTRR